MAKLVSPNQVGAKGQAGPNSTAPAKGKFVAPGGPSSSKADSKGR